MCIYYAEKNNLVGCIGYKISKGVTRHDRLCLYKDDQEDEKFHFVEKR
jgi:hypothetical protein